MPKKVKKGKAIDDESELLLLSRGKRIPEHVLHLFVLHNRTDDNESEFCLERTLFGPQAKVCYCSRKKGAHKVHVALLEHTGPLVCNPWK